MKRLSIRIVTDSTADIPAELREALDIEMVALSVHFEDESFRDAVTIQADEFYDKLQHASKPPTTSQPSPVDFMEVYTKLAAEPGTEIISIHLSSALSGTYQSAVLAKSLMESDADITTVDSKSASYGLGLLVVKAAEAAKAGKNKEEILEMLQDLREKSSLFFLVDTFEYLHKGGRIGKAAAVIGSLLNIKPILSLDDEGGVVSVDKIRGQKKAFSRIIQLLKDRHGERKLEIVIAQSKAKETARELSALVREHLHVVKETFTTLGPVIGTHTGPGTVAVFAIPSS